MIVFCGVCVRVWGAQERVKGDGLWCWGEAAPHLMTQHSGVPMSHVGMHCSDNID